MYMSNLFYMEFKLALYTLTFLH